MSKFAVPPGEKRFFQVLKRERFKRKAVCSGLSLSVRIVEPDHFYAECFTATLRQTDRRRQLEEGEKSSFDDLNGPRHRPSGFATGHQIR